MKKGKILNTLKISTILIIVLFMLSVISNAATTTFGLEEYRKARPNGSQYGYKVLEQKIWKVAKYNNNATTIDYDTAVYCLRAGYGFFTATPGEFRANYNASYNFKDKNAIPGLHTDLSTNYKSILWILDNAYTVKSPTATNDKVALLTAAGIPSDSELTDDDIDVIQQLAIWYFTNTSEIQYHKDFAGLPNLQTVSQSIKTSAGVAGSYLAIDDVNTYRYQDMEILYQYIVTSAKDPNNLSQYDQNISSPPISLDTKNPSSLYDEENERYILGPYKINKNNNIPYTATMKFTNQNGTEFKKYRLLNSNKQNYSGTISDLIGQEFYISIEKTDAEDITKINFVLDGNYKTSNMIYWTISGDNTAQPLVEIEKTTNPITGTNSVGIQKIVPKYFDLSLRKFITGINNTQITGREPQVDVTKLANGTATTATYNHTKKPVSVKKGDIVTYTIRVYNEGQVDGYVGKITDYLPPDLEFISDRTKYPEETTFNANNGWIIDAQDPRKISTTKLAYSDRTADTSKNAQNIIKAFNGTTLSFKDVQVKCLVKNTATSDRKITNLAQITKATDANGKEVEQGKTPEDRDSIPDGNFTLPSDNNLPNYKDTEIDRGDTYIPGQEDDDDFEKLKVEEFDLSLRKFITGVNDAGVIGREPEIDVTPLVNKTSTTAIYNHPKKPVSIEPGDIVTYTIRVYNEAELSGYANRITDYLPAELEYLPNDSINKQYEWELSQNGRTVTTTYLSKEKEKAERVNLIKAFNGKTLDYKEVKIRCKVKTTAIGGRKITNLAQIIEEKDEDGNVILDRDSEPNGDFILPSDNDLPNYKDPEINKGDKYISGQEDDDDFEKLILKEFDLSLRKFITGINGIEVIGREPQVDLTPLVNKTSTTATYNHPKKPVSVKRGDTVTYTIRAYNEAELSGYANKITDYLPQELEFIKDDELNKQYEWEVSDDGRTVTTTYLSKEKEKAERTNLIKAFDGKTLDYKEVKIKCTVKDTAIYNKKVTNLAQITENKDSKGNNVTDRDSEPDGDFTLPSDENLPNYKDTEIVRGDNYIPGQEDYDDFEKVKIVYFDLALRKFITGVNDQEIATRIPQVTLGQDGNIKYEHTKTPVDVEQGNKVTYTLRIFNEGLINGYASEVIDDVPDGLIFLPEDETNKEYRWVMYKQINNEPTVAGIREVKNTTNKVKAQQNEENNQEKVQEEDTNNQSNKENSQENDENKNNEVFIYGNKKYIKTDKPEEADLIKTDYLSKEQEKEEGSNLIKAFDKEQPISDTNPDHRDLKINFKVTEPNTSDRIIINTAEISDDRDETNKPVEDIDSTPGNENEWEKEDDLDKEFIKVKYFDLALKKWVSKVILIENGEQTVTDTGHTGDEDPEPIVKVDLHSKKLNKVTVKFEYQIKVTNEGEIAGYTKEVTDYIPGGLKFIQEDNPNWYTREPLNGRERVATRALENTLLQPGQSANVPIILTWINDAENMGVKVNIAEISEDYNDSHTPDIDSTPDNFIDGEDDQDDAPVMLAIELGQIKICFGIIFTVLITIGLGVFLIKKYVLF